MAGKLSLAAFAAQWRDPVTQIQSNLEHGKIMVSVGRSAAIITRDYITDSNYRGRPYEPIKEETIRKRKYRIARTGRTNRPSMLEANSGDSSFARKYPPFSDTKPLVETGRLWNSISFETRRRGVIGFKSKVFSDKRSFANADDRHKRNYAHYNNEGMGRVPARQFFANYLIDNDDINEAVLSILTNPKGRHIFYGLPGDWGISSTVTDKVVGAQVSRARALGYDKM